MRVGPKGLQAGKGGGVFTTPPQKGAYGMEFLKNKPVTAFWEFSDRSVVTLEKMRQVVLQDSSSDSSQPATTLGVGASLF